MVKSMDSSKAKVKCIFPIAGIFLEASKVPVVAYASQVSRRVAVARNRVGHVGNYGHSKFRNSSSCFRANFVVHSNKICHVADAGFVRTTTLFPRALELFWGGSCKKIISLRLKLKSLHGTASVQLHWRLRTIKQMNFLLNFFSL